MLVTFGVIVPQAVSMTTCRCCLYTVNFACVRYHRELPSTGFYAFDGHAGIYPHPGTYRFTMQDVQVRRTRFGWPWGATTLDVVQGVPEWHIEFDKWATALNILECYVLWLCLDPVVRILRILARRFSNGASPRVT